MKSLYLMAHAPDLIASQLVEGLVEDILEQQLLAATFCLIDVGKDACWRPGVVVIVDDLVEESVELGQTQCQQTPVRYQHKFYKSISRALTIQSVLSEYPVSNEIANHVVRVQCSRQHEAAISLRYFFANPFISLVSWQPAVVRQCSHAGTDAFGCRSCEESWVSPKNDEETCPVTARLAVDRKLVGCE